MARDANVSTMRMWRMDVRINADEEEEKKDHLRVWYLRESPTPERAQGRCVSVIHVWTRHKKNLQSLYLCLHTTLCLTNSALDRAHPSTLHDEWLH